MIGGLIVSGDAPRTVLIRAIGPTLANYGLTAALPNPTITLHDGTGAAIRTGGAWNPAWTDAGAPPLDPREPVIRATLAPGNYTVVLADAQSRRGTALLEVYDLDPAGGTMAAISTRGKVDTGDDIMIGGFILDGDEPGRVVVRAIGPSLAPYGVRGALSDPTLELYNGSGSLIYANDNWRTDQEQQLVASGVAPADDSEAAIIATLPPGSYTAVVRGSHSTTGVALVEVYRIAR